MTATATKTIDQTAFDRMIAATKSYAGPTRRADLEKILNAVSAKYGHDPRFLRTIAQIESSFTPAAYRIEKRNGMPYAVSLGLCQILWPNPLNVLRGRVDHTQGEYFTDALDPVKNATYAAELLKEIFRKWKTPEDVFAVYNAGPIKTSGVYPNQGYVDKSMRVFRSL